MITKSNTISDYNIKFYQFTLYKRKLLNILYIFIIITSVISFIIFFGAKSFSRNEFTSDMLVADFRNDLNKLWEMSRIIESKRINNPNSEISAFGTTGEILDKSKINKNLKLLLKNIADSNLDNNLSENEIKALGIMVLDKNLFSEELRRFQYNNLATDNNLDHYVIITKGNYAGTLLYNGGLLFTDSNNRRYFGVELSLQ